MEICVYCDSKMFVWFVLFFGLIPEIILGYATNRYDDEHSFRHQQHYNQRIEQAVNDFKISQAHKNATQVYLRHHRMKPDELKEKQTTPTIISSIQPERHHLRHYNRHHQTWEHRVFPLVQQQQTPTTSSPLSLKRKENDADIGRYNLTSTMQNRYFDRDGLYSMTKLKTGNFVIHGPKSRDSHNMASVRKLSFDHYKTVNNNYDDDRDSVIIEDTSGKRSKNTFEDDDNSNEYYEDSDGRNVDDDDDDDDSLEDGEDDDEDLENVDVNRNKIDNENNSSNRRRINNLDSEDIFSRSYIPGTLTKHKYETLGTHEAVEKSRKSHITNQQQHRALANAHVNKVYMEATCKWPKPKVEKIQKDPSKMYVPHCTILHRCGDDTGCCTTETQTCVPKHSQSVDLYFFVKALGTKQGTIEQHTFVNHTECQCVDKIKYLNQAPSPLMRRATVLDCNCPKLFEKVLQEDGVCRCDCSSGNSGCDWLKRGMEHFSMADRKCIIEGRCKLPTCEYGSYVRKHGRCPKKEDKLAFSRNYH